MTIQMEQKTLDAFKLWVRVRKTIDTLPSAQMMTFREMAHILDIEDVALFAFCLDTIKNFFDGSFFSVWDLNRLVKSSDYSLEIIREKIHDTRRDSQLAGGSRS